MSFKNYNNVCACAVSAVILLPVVNLSPEIDIGFVHDGKSLAADAPFPCFDNFSLRKHSFDYISTSGLKYDVIFQLSAPVLPRNAAMQRGLGSRKSVCLHIRSLWQNQIIYCRHFYTVRKGNHSSFLADSGWWAVGLLSEICAQMTHTLSKNADFDRFRLITSQP